MENNGKEVLLFSGGMDSLISYFYVGKPQLIYFCLNHRYEYREFDVIQRLERMLNTKVKFSRMFNLRKYEHPDAHIPLRNYYVAQGVLSEFPDVTKIYLACQKGEQSIPDRSPEFFKDITHILSKEAERPVEVINTFPDMTKVQMVKWYMENVGDVEILKASVGCYSAEDIHCGSCGACLRRSVAFAANNIPLDEMKNNIKKWTGITEYIDKMKAGKYDAERTEETLKVFKDWGYSI